MRIEIEARWKDSYSGTTDLVAGGVTLGGTYRVSNIEFWAYVAGRTIGKNFDSESDAQAAVLTALGARIIKQVSP